jgi:hypothetical protein
MNNVPLFIEVTTPTIEKIAFSAKLSENADTWPKEVLDELLKQHPYLGIYDISPIMTEVNGDRGVGIGFFQVSNTSATAALGPGGEALRSMQGVKTVRVPIIIKENKLCPLDVMMQTDGKAFPLNERRMREALHRPQLFDAIKKSPGDQSMVESLYPPTARQRGIQAGQVVDAPQMKIGSHKPRFLLNAIAPTILQGDLDKVASTLENDENLARVLVYNNSTRDAIEFIGTLEATTAADVEKVAAKLARPDVIQVSRDGEVYRLKMANSQDFSPEVVEADRPTMAAIAGQDLVTKADKSGAVTVTTDPVVRDTLEDEIVEVVTRFGEYKVKTVEGKELIGWVFPTILDFDGTALPIQLFTNGSNSALQSQIAGSLIGKSSNIIRGKPVGYGFFYRVTASGNVLAFIPVEIKSPFSDPSGEGYIVHTMMGLPATIRFAPGSRKIVKTGPEEYTLPADVRWAPLGDVIPLMSDPTEFAKIANLKDVRNTVRIVSDRTTWSFQSGPGLNKVAHLWKEGLSGENAMFVACSFGMDPTTAARALVKAAKDGSAEVRGCREIHIHQEKLAAARKEAAKLMSEVPKKYMLLKEAAGLDDMTTVDHILSLGFINTENIKIFINYLPELEESVSKLAELLVAARTGMKDIPEDSIKSAMERLDEVIVGLKELLHREHIDKTSAKKHDTLTQKLIGIAGG